MSTSPTTTSFEPAPPNDPAAIGPTSPTPPAWNDTRNSIGCGPPGVIVAVGVLSGVAVFVAVPVGLGNMVLDGVAVGVALGGGVAVGVSVGGKV